MDPIILKKFSNRKNINTIGYDEKADIWSIGIVCYELLRGKAVFNAKTMNDLVDKVQSGNYCVREKDTLSNHSMIQNVSFIIW